METTKTTEKFKSVHQTFSYTPPSAWTNQWSSLAFGIGMIVVPLIYPFGLRIRRAVILSPAVFSTILIIGGVLLLIMTYFDIRKARVLAAQGGTITVDKGRVTYPEVNKSKIEYNSFLISDISYIKDDDEENQFKVSLPDKYIVFETKYFVRALPVFVLHSWGIFLICGLLALSHPSPHVSARPMILQSSVIRERDQTL